MMPVVNCIVQTSFGISLFSFLCPLLSSFFFHLSLPFIFLSFPSSSSSSRCTKRHGCLLNVWLNHDLMAK